MSCWVEQPELNGGDYWSPTPPACFTNNRHVFQIRFRSRESLVNRARSLATSDPLSASCTFFPVHCGFMRGFCMSSIWRAKFSVKIEHFVACLLSFFWCHTIEFLIIYEHYFSYTYVECFTLFENYSKCRIWILAFSINFCPIKTDMSANTVWPQASGFQKLAKWTICGIFN